MKIYIAADHNGFEYKQKLTSFLTSAGHEVVDKGSLELQPTDDFPQLAGAAVSALLADHHKQSRAILICGSGQGMCMAANRFKGIRASLCWNVAEARAARNDDNSNVLCLAARYTPLSQATSITTTFLNTPFAGAARFVRRLNELDQLG